MFLAACFGPASPPCLWRSPSISCRPADNSGRFSFAQQFEGKRGGFQGPLLRPLYPPHTKCKSLERAITSPWRGSAFTGGGDKTGSLSCEAPPRLPPSMHSLSLIALFTPRHSRDKTVKIKVNHRRGSRRTTHNHRKLHLLRKNKKTLQENLDSFLSWCQWMFLLTLIVIWHFRCASYWNLAWNVF